MIHFKENISNILLKPLNLCGKVWIKTKPSNKICQIFFKFLFFFPVLLTGSLGLIGSGLKATLPAPTQRLNIKLTPEQEQKVKDFGIMTKSKDFIAPYLKITLGLFSQVEISPLGLASKEGETRVINFIRTDQNFISKTSQILSQTFNQEIPKVESLKNFIDFITNSLPIEAMNTMITTITTYHKITLYFLRNLDIKVVAQ